MKIKLPILISIFIFSFIVNIQAQNEVWKSYTNTDNVTCTAFQGDSIWIGTTFGVLCRDIKTGALIAEYRTIDGLAGNYITGIAIDDQGNKWFATKNNGASKFDGINWVTYDTTNSGIVYNDLNAVTIDTLGNLWFATNGMGASKFDGVNWTTYDMAGNYVNCITVDKQGNIWFGMWPGAIVTKFDGINWIQYGPTNTILPGSSWIEGIAIDLDGNKWIATGGGKGIYKFNDTTWTKIATSNTTVHADDYGSVWFGGSPNGISEFDGQSWIYYQISASYENYGFNTIAIDKYGNKWVGTSGPVTYGAGILKQDSTEWTYYNSINASLTGNEVKSITVDDYGNNWIGTDNGISVFDGTSWVTYNEANTGQMMADNVRCIAKDLLGNTWMGSEMYNGALKYDGTNWTDYGYASGIIGLSERQVNDIAIDAQNNIWFATDGKGVVKFDGTNWINYNTSNSGIVANSIFCVVVDDQDNKWFGTTSGVSMFDGVNWTTYKSTNSGLASNGVKSIAIDVQGNKWFGTSNYGASKFDGTNWTTYNTSNSGLVNNSINQIAISNNGNVWFATSNGISKFNGTNWVTYNKDNSDLSDNYVISIAIDKLGNKWFGTYDKGISTLDDGEDAFFTYKPKLKGNIYHDKNKNNQKDSDENYLSNQKIRLLPGNHVAVTNALGEYVFSEDYGTYQIQYEPHGFWTATVDSIYTVELNDTLISVPDIGIYAVDTTVITGVLTNGPNRCNVETPCYFTYRNEGTIADSGYIAIQIDPAVIVISSSPVYDSIVNNTAYFKMSSILPGETRTIKLNLLMPPFTMMGVYLNYTTQIVASNYNNSQTIERVLLCSYDPNEKEVSPVGLSDQGYTLKDELLTYTIRFQNTGNDTAFNILLQDTISPLLDCSTLNVLTSSHVLNTTMDTNGLVNFYFPDIHLPDSTTNETDSHGFVTYSISLKDTIPALAEITNTAYIYFDFNPAIVTNTTTNNMVDSIANETIWLCHGDSFTFKDGSSLNNITTAQNHQSLSVNSGKSLIVFTQLNLYPTYTQSYSNTICQGDSILFEGNYYDSTGVYSLTYQTINGCDSVFTLGLTVDPIYDLPQSAIICQNDSLFFEGNYYSTTGIYTKTYQTINGCDSILTFDLKVNPVYSEFQSSSICNGDSILFEGTYYSEAGEYIKAYQTINGCDSITTLELTVDSLDLSISKTNNTLTANTSGAIYQWINCDNDSIIEGETGQSFNPNLTGNYAVVIDYDNCSDTSECINVTIIGIEENESDNTIKIYPNPTNNSVTIKTGNTAAKSIALVNLLGETLLTIKPSNHLTIIGLSGFSEGTYFLHIQSQEKHEVIKLIKL